MTLARGARLRAYAPAHRCVGAGAAVRDIDGRTYAAATVENADPALTTSALRAAVVAAASSGARAFEAAVVVSEAEPTPRTWPSSREFGRRPVARRRSRRRRSGDLPLRLRLLRRPAQRRQVDADQRPHRAEGRDHVVAAADHPARRPRHHPPAGRAARPGRHPRSAQAAHPAGPAAQRPGARDLRQRRPHLLLRHRRRQARPGRPVHRRRAGAGDDPDHRGRHQDRPGRPRTGWGSSCSPSTRCTTGPTSIPTSAVDGFQVELLARPARRAAARGPDALPGRAS